MPSILRLIRKTDVFNKEEKAVAGELVIDALKKRGEDPDYKIIVAQGAGGRLLGYICYGPTPMTAGTWDIYWVVVSPAARKRGIGKKMLLQTLSTIKSKNGKRIIIDTSSQRSYRPARALYEGTGFKPAGTVPDYYRKGWHRITYYKIF